MDCENSPEFPPSDPTQPPGPDNLKRGAQTHFFLTPDLASWAATAPSVARIHRVEPRSERTVRPGPGVPAYTRSSSPPRLQTQDQMRTCSDPIPSRFHHLSFPFASPLSLSDINQHSRHHAAVVRPLFFSSSCWSLFHTNNYLPLSLVRPVRGRVPLLSLHR